MAQFKGTLSGNRGQVSRLGSKKSGMIAIVNSWNQGVKIIADHIDGEDVFTVFLTGGSNGIGFKGFIWDSKHPKT